LRAVAQAGGAALWAGNARPYEDAVALCVTFLDDASCAAGDVAGAALGDFVAAAASAAAVDAVRPSLGNTMVVTLNPAPWRG
jgi:hypothetical protein